jgi:hypothetical protein
MKFLGSSKVSSKLRISLVKDAADLMIIQDGSHILFYSDEGGQILITTTMPTKVSGLRFLGSTKIGANLRISLVKVASDLMRINEGDHVVYYQNGKGQIFIKKG